MASEEPIEEEFELTPVKPSEVSPRTRNYWKYACIFTSLALMWLIFYLFKSANPIEAKQYFSKPFSGDISSAANFAFKNIFENGGEGREQEKLLETIDLNKISPKDKKTFIAKDVGDTKSLALGAIKIEAVKTNDTDINIVINEVFFNPNGSDQGKEFIEIFNPNDAEIDLKDYALRFSGINSSSTVSLAKIGGSKNDKTLIKAKGFFLVGLNSYGSPPIADAKRSASLTNTAGTVYLYDASGKVLEAVAYSEAIPEGQSLERESGVSTLFLNQPNPSPKNSD